MAEEKARTEIIHLYHRVQSKKISLLLFQVSRQPGISKFTGNIIKLGIKQLLTAYQLLALMSAKFLISFFGDWYLQRFLSVVSV
jgi:hypothetical protein